MAKKKYKFTLLELLTAMTVFTIFMLAVMRFFGLTQDVMSAATEKTSNYEKARVVMDLIANHLRNIYFVEGSYCHSYFTKQDGDKYNVNIAVQQPAKMGKSVTGLVWVLYQYNSTAKTLSMYSVGDEDYRSGSGAWKLYNYNQTDENNIFDVSLLDIGPGSVVLEGVTSFKLLPFKYKDDGTTEGLANPSPSINKPLDNGDPTRRIPDTVKIELKIANSDMLTKYWNAKNESLGKEVTDSELEESSSLYTREVVIDRGQF